MENRRVSISVTYTHDDEDIHSFGSAFGVLWLDKWFSKSLSDDELGDFFKKVSDELGGLVIGQYESKMKQYALLSLLGPAFVGKHFVGQNRVNIRALEKLKLEEVYKDSKKYTSTFSNIEQNLKELSDVALKRCVSLDEYEKLERYIFSRTFKRSTNSL